MQENNIGTETKEARQEQANAESRLPGNNQNSKESKDNKEIRDNKDSRENRDNKDNRENRDNRNYRDMRDNRENRENRENHDNRGDNRYASRGRTETDKRDSKDTGDSRRSIGQFDSRNNSNSGNVENNRQLRDNRDNKIRRDNRENVPGSENQLVKDEKGTAEQTVRNIQGQNNQQPNALPLSVDPQKDKPSDNQRLKNQPIQKDRNYPKRQGVSGDAGYRRERTNAVSRAAETVNAGNLSSYQRRPVKLAMKAEETVEDIKIDITRIEKEIKMEVKEIRSMKL